MASAEQPPKKRKFYEAARSEPEPAPTSPPTQALADPHSAADLPPSQEEILVKRRNKDEIRSVYECYKRIKFCLSHKRDSDLEQAYLSLISASRGCTSVQRIVAELIPRYASNCPTAFEAAAKVVMNMHNWSLEIMQKGEDIDGVSFQIAKSCISGLSDICCRACSEAPASSAVVREICSAALQSSLAFFVSSFKDREGIHLVVREFAKVRDSADEFHELSRKISDGSEPPPVVLLKLRVLSLFRVFYRYPRNLLAACFDLFDSATLGGVRDGLYFLSQLSRKFDLDGAVPVLKTSDENKSHIGSVETVLGSQEAHPDSQTCFMAMVLRKDPSLRSWVVSNFKRISQLSTSKIFSEIKSIMENVVESFTELAGADNDVRDSNSSESTKPSNFKRSRSYQNDTYAGSNSNARVRGGSSDDVSERVSGHYSSFHSEASYQDSGVMRTVDIGQHGETAHGIPSPVTRHSLDFRSNSFDSTNHGIGMDKRMGFRSPTGRSTSGGLSNPFASPKHNLANSQIIWHSDGDPATMDIFSASKQLWVGLLGPDTSEAHVRYEFERFGPIDQFFSFPTKGFCVIDYRNIFDGIKARDYLRRNFHWHIKFMDTGLGTRGLMNYVAVGSSCLVYIGSVSNQWEKDEILYESSRVVYKGPSLITDLKNEGALLMELDTPEEAAAVMAHLRQYRKERSNSLSHMDSADRGRMSPLTSLLVSLRAKYNVHQSLSYVAMQEEDKPPSSAIEISVPNNSPFLSDDEVAAVCNIAISNLGSVNCVTRTNSQSGCTWYVECSGVDAAMAVLSNLRRCPEMFFQIQFSQQRAHHFSSFSGRTDSMELVSPRVASEAHLAAAQGGHPFHSNRGLPEMLEAGPARMDGTDTNMAVDPSHGGSHSVSSATEQNWVYTNPEIDPPPPPGSVHTATQGHPAPPPPQIQSSQYMRPAYIPPNISWDPQRGLNQNFPLNPISPVAGPNNAVASPFVHPQVQHFESMFSVPMVAPPSLVLPPPPEMPPPLPPSPPPPSSPPPPPPEFCQPESSEQLPQYQWQGVLCKSGVHYCSINALAVHSDICKYSSTSSEPTEWPAKLDMTKRTDFQHVQSTFKNTPPHKREVCMLVPSSPNDQKGDFLSYLKQRECAGVIKLPLSKSIWSRLLFILPHSLDFCSMFSIAPTTAPHCLIALLLPKETNFEWL